MRLKSDLETVYVIEPDVNGRFARVVGTSDHCGRVQIPLMLSCPWVPHTETIRLAIGIEERKEKHSHK
jgi:hypothetical protein